MQLKNNTDVAELEREFLAISLTSQALLGKDVNIWKFSFDAKAITIDDAIEALYGSNLVVEVQRNHILKNRATTPNDSLFASQWQYVQFNDRDIDADLAWDITTGGVTPQGDTIVICVIDDGIFTDHEDFQGNLWVNRNEIPNNVIDDDGNGYVDDVLGWNVQDDNDSVRHDVGEGHGSMVAGIVGAKGNNNIGVAGVMWNVKLMIVRNPGNTITEANALAAYSYALANRKLYNATNGALGAFVVATNASWGIDSARASSAPLWCAMYDTLGMHGILSAGATINGNVNVDTIGDLPTECPSDYLITVTNTSINDIKVTHAGYGLVTIDLGAPGQDAFTISYNITNEYGPGGGTSAATPHVTGTIGLLYASPCLNFAKLSKSNPSLAALKAKEYILNGVDLKLTLAGKTVTGGRLNVHKALLALNADCTALQTGEEVERTSQLIVYPNPIIGNSFKIEFSVESQIEAWIYISDLTGKTVEKQRVELKPGENSIEIAIGQNLSKGIYQLELRLEKGSLFQKIAK